MESPNTSFQAVELSPSCSGQSHPNRPGTGPGHKNTEPGKMFTVLRILFIICPLRSADAKFGKVFQKIARSWHKRTKGSYVTRTSKQFRMYYKLLADRIRARSFTWFEMLEGKKYQIYLLGLVLWLSKRQTLLERQV